MKLFTKCFILSKAAVLLTKLLLPQITLLLKLMAIQTYLVRSTGAFASHFEREREKKSKVRSGYFPFKFIKHTTTPWSCMLISCLPLIFIFLHERFVNSRSTLLFETIVIGATVVPKFSFGMCAQCTCEFNAKLREKWMGGQRLAGSGHPVRLVSGAIHEPCSVTSDVQAYFSLVESSRFNYFDLSDHGGHCNARLC